MATETVLVPKDKYERLLKISELYTNMTGARTHEDVTRHPTVENNESVSQDLNITPLREEDHHVVTQSAVPDLKNITPPRDNKEEEDPEVNQSAESNPKKIKRAPPGIRLRVMTKSLNKLKHDLRKKRNSKPAKTSRTWLSW